VSHTGTCDATLGAHDESLPIAAVDPAGARPGGEEDRDGRASSSDRWALRTVPEVRWAALASVLLLTALGAQAVAGPDWLRWALYAGCFLSGGWGPARAGIQALRAGRLDVDLLMIAAGLGAAAIGQVFDGGLLIVIFASSGALEAVATKRTRDSVRSLLALAPEQASRRSPGGREELVDSTSLVAGDVVVVRPGERIGADGVVVDGTSEVDQATITGEPLPVLRAPGDEVFAGTLNRDGVLVVRVSRLATASVMARIVAMVEEASATKASAQLFVERIEQRYSVGVVVATLGLFALPLALGAALQPTLLRAMTFMIVASPCAVVLATMPPLLSAIANAGRHGVLVKSAAVIERMATATVVAFDKTGTLTEGTPRVSKVVPMPPFDTDGDVVIALAASAEQPSQHPLGRAIVAAAAERGLRVKAPRDFTSSPGRGIRAVVDGLVVEVGSPALLEGVAGGREQARRTVADLERGGRTAVVVLVDGSTAGVLSLADRLRPGAGDAVRDLGRLTGRRPLLLTGDNVGAARRLAEETGIGDVHAGLLPQDKVTLVQRMQATGERVLMVGDGVNDAPALAAAHLGMAMGRHGSDLALETADAVVIGDDLATLPAGLGLARKLPLPLGVAGHEGSTVVVGLNGLRLLRHSAWSLPDGEANP